MEFICERCRCMHLAPLALVIALLSARAAYRIKCGPMLTAVLNMSGRAARRGVPGGWRHQPTGVNGSLRRLPVFRPAFLAYGGLKACCFFIVERQLCQDEQGIRPFLPGSFGPETAAPARQNQPCRSPKENARAASAAACLRHNLPHARRLAFRAPAGGIPEHFAMRARRNAPGRESCRGHGASKRRMPRAAERPALSEHNRKNGSERRLRRRGPGAS